MSKPLDLCFSFEIPHFKLLFEHSFLSNLREETAFNIRVQNKAKEKIGKDYVYTKRWITVDFFSSFFRRRNERQSKAKTHLIDYLIKVLDLKVNSSFLLKIVIHSSDKKRFVFLFETVSAKNISDLINGLFEKAKSYKKGNLQSRKEIKTAYKLNSNKYYYKFEEGKWQHLDIVFNAGKMWHDHIPKEITDKRTNKAEVWLHRKDFTKKVYHKNRWALKVNGRSYIRLKPNDIALYSNISSKNLQAAKKIYGDKHMMGVKFLSKKVKQLYLIILSI